MQCGTITKLISSGDCTLQCGMWLWNRDSKFASGSTLQVIRGSGMTCHWIRPNVRHIGILHLVSISTHHISRHVTLYQSAKFYPNRTTLGGLILSKSDHPWRTLCKHVTIGHFCCFDCLLTVFDDWYTVGTDSVPIVTGLPRLYQQCTNRQKQSKTVKRQSKQQKWTLVYQSSHVYQECTNRVPTVYQSLKTVKRQSKQQKWPLVYQSSHDTSTPQYIKTVPTVYHQCTNRQKQSKTVKRQSKTAKMTIGVPIVTYLPRLYQSSHVYTESAEYIKSASASASAWAVRVRVRRIHKAPIGHQ